METPRILQPMRARARQLLTPGSAALLAAAVFALPAALASDAGPEPPRASASAKTPRCFGAASRDTVTRCRNPALRTRVIPKPYDAVLLPNAPCEPIYNTTPFQCEFGQAVEESKGTIALLGDSHATHWRGGLIEVSKHYDWHGISLTRSGCTFSTAEPVLPGKLKQECLDWRAQVYQWFTDNPQVRTVFISQHPGKVVVPRGSTEQATKRRGFREAWKLLPDSVKHIVIIRDTPYVSSKTPDCINAAMKRKLDAGRACALPRSRALKVDDAAEAAKGFSLPGLRVIDMTNYLCSTKECFPVVGGALTHKDQGHITAIFSATTGPFLLRKVRSFGIKI